MAMLFVLVVNFVVKHVAGTRGFPQAASMLETEVTAWQEDPCGHRRHRRKMHPRMDEDPCEEDPCEKFGAENVEMRHRRHRREMRDVTCSCPSDRFFSSKECGGRQDWFPLSKATEGCRCLTMVEAVERRSKMPVAASALRFCDALVEQGFKIDHHSKDMRLTMKDALSKTSPEICQHALTGTINETEAKEAPFAKKASELSQKGSDGDPDRGYGRMRPVKEDATGSTEEALWKQALAQVCKDECKDLLKMMKEKAEDLAYDVTENHVPFAQACAEWVVQHVEAEILGCCARSCGFDGRRCLLWPFFSPQEKVEWEVECCAEISILKNSSRELMCNSVLPDRLAKKASNFDLEEQSGTDVGKVLIGQNTSLFWTEKGAQKSALGKEIQAHDGDKVSMDFLIKHKKVGEEYLRLGYFKEEPITKILDEATSMMEVSSQDDTCNFGHFEEQCPKKFMTTFVEKCNEAWNVAKDFRRFLTHPGGGDCDESDPQNFSTPEECQKLAKNSFGTVFLHYFEYNKDKDLPIKCFSVSVSKKQCKGKDDWWKRIKGKFMSVEKLMNDKKRDVNDYAQLVYIKSMKTN